MCATRLVIEMLALLPNVAFCGAKSFREKDKTSEGKKGEKGGEKIRKKGARDEKKKEKKKALKLLCLSRSRFFSNENKNKTKKNKQTLKAQHFLPTQIAFQHNH